MDVLTQKDLFQSTINDVSKILIKVLFFFVVPLLILSLLRIPKMGFLPVMYLHCLLGFVISLCFIFKSRTNLKIRAWVIIIFFYLIGVGGIITNSQVIYAAPAFILGLLFCTLFFNKKISYLFQVLQILSAIIITFLHSHKVNLTQEIFIIIAYIITFAYYTTFTVEKVKSKFIVLIDELKSALVVKDRFLALMSHEIRTPLNGVIMGLDQLSDEISPAHKNSLEGVKSSSHTLLEIVNNILDLSKFNAGKLSLNNQSFNLKDLAERITASYQPLCKAKGIQFTLNYNLENSFFVGDRIRINQIIGNLVNNSIKFTSRGEISLGLKENISNIIELTIKDTGIGVDSERIQHVFDSFEQETIETSTRFGGTGLGLSIVKKLVDMMDGEVHIQSQKGTGTCVTVKLPLPRAKEAPTPHHSGEDSGLKVSFKPNTTLLLVEDNKVNYTLVTKTLNKLGIDKITLAQDGKEAIELSNNQFFDIILMDNRMPVMSGLEATTIIRKESKLNRNTPIIFVSAHSYQEDIDKALSVGANMYLTKPISRKDLIAGLKKFVKPSGPS